MHANAHKEIGWFDVTATAGAGAIVPERLRVFHWHGDTFDLPRDAVNLMRSEACEHQWFAIGRDVQGIQFHLEATPETVRGMLDACANDLTPGPYVQSPAEALAGASHTEAPHAVLARVLDDWLPPA